MTLGLSALLVFAATAGATMLATRIVLQVLERRAILDHPNERSSHARPTPRGGGIAVLAVLIPAWIAIAAVIGRGDNGPIWLVIGGIAALAALSWLDDLRDLSAGVRILCHAAAVGAVLASLPASALLFQGLLPPLADRIAAAVLWLWFINLFNFMDGIDGIAGVEAMTIGGGLFLLAALHGLAGGAMAGGPVAMNGWLALALAGAACGFLLWNWHPARLFLGDVGSVPLGFALGWLLLQAAMAGFWAAALILPFYYLADATITLTRRALRGERVWSAHREHFYQKAVASGRSHAEVVRAIATANAVLIVLALAAERSGFPMRELLVTGAAATVALLLLHLAGAWRRAPQ